jgi:predicted SprT family Zn-dependent metalloprotease
MRDTEVYQIIHHVCRANDCPELAGKILFQWSNKLTACIGIMDKRHNESYYTMKLSIKLFARADEDTKRDTVAHEVCHAVDYHKNESSMGHGAEWKQAMMIAGYKPERYHDVSNAGLIKKFVYKCPVCEKKYNLSARRHNLIRQGRRRICGVCIDNHILQFTGEIIYPIDN